MTIIDAEKCFKKYEGHFFHMGREEPTLYDAYKSLDISEETEEQWRQEMIDDFLEHLFDVLDVVSYKFSSIISIIYDTKTQKEKNVIKLISALEKMSQIENLDKFSKILIIEAMSGNLGYLENGACTLICMHTSAEQRKRMNATVLKLADFTCTDDDNLKPIYGDMKKRHKDAVENYKARYEIFKDANSPQVKIETIDDLFLLFSYKQQE